MSMNTDFQKMRVSFDLDEVLFVNPANHKTEPQLRFPYNILYKERLRLGAPELIKELQRRDFEVWVYTTSFRTERYIKRLFRCYKVRFDGIVNGQRHQAEVSKGRGGVPTKLPNRYRISLHIDDEDIVVSYGRDHGFDVYQLDAQDDEWTQKILDRALAVKKKKDFERRAIK